VALAVPKYAIERADAAKGFVFAIDDRGRGFAKDDPILREAVESGWRVIAVDPRGIGEMGTSKMGWVAAVSLLLGDNFVARQASDLLRVMSEYKGQPFAVYTSGHNSSLAAIYALAHPAAAGVSWYALRGGFLSYRQFIDRPKSARESFQLVTDEKTRREQVLDREIPFYYVPFDVLRYFDLPDLLARVKAPGVIVNPINGDWERVEEQAARALVPSGVRVVSIDEPSAAAREAISRLW
jgi:pimeloyl-ACP methyl ester carboxylesterase